MSSLSRYFTNPFASRNISIEELVSFTGDHLGKLLALAPATPDYDSAIALTQPLFAALDGKITDETLKKALQKARTSALAAKRDAIHRELSRVEIMVQGPYPKGSETYIEIFPNGLTAFREAPTDGLENLLDATLTSLDAHSAALGDYTALSTLTAQWKALRGDQVSQKGAAANAGEQRRAASDALRAQLFDNLLFIARRNQGQPGELSNYFSQHLLEDPAAPADPEP